MSPVNQQLNAFVEAHEVFAALSDKTKSQLQGINSIQTFDEGELVSHTSVVAQGVHLITGGTARIYTLDEHGNQPYVSTLSSGGIIGLFSVMNEKPNIHMIKVVKPMTTVFLPAEPFRKIVYADPKFCEQMIKFICNWLKYFSDLAIRFAVMKPFDRIVHCLADSAPVYLPGDTEAPVELKISLSQYELSEMLALSRQCINLHLKRLNALGVLSIGYKSVTILDLPKLNNLVEKATPN